VITIGYQNRCKIPYKNHAFKSGVKSPTKSNDISWYQMMSDLKIGVKSPTKITHSKVVRNRLQNRMM